MSSTVKLQINRGNAAENMNLKALRNVDKAVQSIQASTGHVAVYKDHQDGNGWHTFGCEGALFVVNRKTDPRTKIIVLNRKGRDNFSAVVDSHFTQELHDQHCMFRCASGLWCAWVPDANEAKRVHAFLGEAARRASNARHRAKGKKQSDKRGIAPRSGVASEKSGAVKKTFSYAAAAGASTAMPAVAVAVAGAAGNGKEARNGNMKAGSGQQQATAASVQSEKTFDLEGSKVLQNMLGIGGVGGGNVSTQVAQQAQVQPGVGSPNMHGQALPNSGQPHKTPSAGQWQQQLQQQSNTASNYAGMGIPPTQQQQQRAGGLMHLTKLQLQETLINLIRDDNFISLLHKEYTNKVRQQRP